ncbi:MAG: DUF3298 and DUF4163 domain-containing protein [Anaerovoracaceae bacterium]|jgi:hypothetical protein
MNADSITVNKVIVESTMNYKGVPVLHYRIEYPQFWHAAHEKILDDINKRYLRWVNQLQEKYETVYYQEAIKDYECRTKSNFPFHAHEAISTYEITYLQDSLISLFYDHYLYSGGAHGTTKRASSTVNIQTGCQVRLFQNATDPAADKALILDRIREQIVVQMRMNKYQYFDDYPQLIYEHFNPESFYLTPEGIVIYYQQYEIAPYSSGIPEFLINYQL